jgi:hypothetical protein
MTPLIALFRTSLATSRFSPPRSCFLFHPKQLRSSIYTAGCSLPQDYHGLGVFCLSNDKNILAGQGLSIRLLHCSILPTFSGTIDIMPNLDVSELNIILGVLGRPSALPSSLVHGLLTNASQAHLSFFTASFQPKSSRNGFSVKLVSLHYNNSPSPTG